MFKDISTTDQFQISDKEEESVVSTDSAVFNDGCTIYTMIDKSKSLDGNGYPVLTYEGQWKNHALSYAFVTRTNDLTEYFIRQNRYGRCYNPLETEEGHTYKPNFKTVNKDTFVKYLEFLKTKKNSWIKSINTN